MKCILFVLLVLSSFTIKAQLGVTYSQSYLDWNAYYEMTDSATKYCNLYLCSFKCEKYDSAHYYKGRAYFFINQAEYYCAIVFGVDSIKTKLYYQPGEVRKKSSCRCDPKSEHM